MKLYIPRIGDKITLTENWNASIYAERRNQKLFDIFDIEMKGCTNDTVISMIIPKGTVLSFSRIFLRSPASSFDSITFIIKSSPLTKLKGARFWVKATDASKIEYEHFTTLKDDIVKFDELFNVVALENDFEDLQQLTSQDKLAIYNELIKGVEPFKLTTNIDGKQYIEKIKYKNTHHNSYNKSLDEIKNLPTGEIVLDMYPVKDKFIVMNSSNLEVKNLFKEIEQAENEYLSRYYATKLGEDVRIMDLKNNFISDISQILTDSNPATIKYKDQSLLLEEYTDLYKILKQLEKSTKSPKKTKARIK